MNDYSSLNQYEINCHFEEACQRGEWPLVQHLLASPELKLHADVHFNDDSALYFSCLQGHLEMVNYLLTSPGLEEKANIHSSDDIPLRTACYYGHVDIVKYLLTSSDLSDHAYIHRMDGTDWEILFDGNKMDVVNYLLFDMKIQVIPSIYNDMSEPHAHSLMRMIEKRDFFLQINEHLPQSNEPSSRPKI